ncbi:MAG: redoxin family protein, partial [Leadbetterella sp.]
SYSDLNDGYMDMKIRAKDKGFKFPYLFDGDLQLTAKAYGPTTTPHVFVFDASRKLRYEGRIDDNEHVGRQKVLDLDNAVNELLENKPVTVTQTKTFGCSIKWLFKNAWKERERLDWGKEPVTIEKIDKEGIKNLIGPNKENNYRLINIWAAWCGPCVTEMSSLTEIDKMYRNRNFEFYTITLDDLKDEKRSLNLLTKKLASNKNFISTITDKYEFIELLDKQWKGSLPYTVFVSPEGKILYRHSGMINDLELRKQIVNNIGRVYP